MGTSTAQEELWQGDFGRKYAERNRGPRLVAANLRLFAEVLSHTDSIDSVIELGANIGLNLRALRSLLPEASLAAVEINPSAADQLASWGEAEVHVGSLTEVELDSTYDLALIKGVLIHLAPEHLPAAYERLHRLSRRYLCLAEYYNPSPVEVDYRGRSGYLYKRDFAGEMLDRYSDLRLISYGFCYRRDATFPQDDITWFLLEKAA